jgi:hypothetical protein
MIVNIDLLGVDHVCDVFVQSADRGEPPSGFPHHRQDGELRIRPQQFAGVFLGAPH